MAFSPDGSLVVSGSMDDTVRIWEIKTKQRQEKLECHAAEVESILFSPDRSLVTSTSRLRNDAVGIWDAATGKCLHALHHDSSRARVCSSRLRDYSSRFCQDGIQCATGMPRPENVNLSLLIIRDRN